jgi:hypothetical protein
MAEIIDFTQRGRDLQNLITAAPVEFRRGDWEGGFAMLCTRPESVRYEAHRQDALRDDRHQHILFVPDHVSLNNGYHYTVLGLYRYRHDEALMRRVYRLAGLMECVVNVPSPVLRTDLLRRFYQSIMEERESLNIVWRGDVKHFLLPLEARFYGPERFFQAVAGAESLKELYRVIDSETAAQFEILGQSYVIYLPRAFSPNSAG